jgi:hypothetical protein
MRAANVDSTAETETGKGYGSGSSMTTAAGNSGATGSGGGSTTAARRGRSAVLRLVFLLGAVREALTRVFRRVPSRFELVVTVDSV